MGMGVSNVQSAYDAYIAQGQMSKKEKAIDNSVKEQVTVEESATIEISKEGRNAFCNTRELMDYLHQNYKTVSGGTVKISATYLRKCLQDEEQRKKLLENLQLADEMEEYNKENLEGYQGMSINIDEDGNMESETYGGKVAVNEGKRLRQIAAAKTTAQIQMVIGLLQGDVSDCQAGVRSGMCDENEVKKAKALLAKAMQKMGELAGKPQEEQESEPDIFALNLLM